MRRSLLVVALLAACAQQPARDDYVFRVAVPGPLSPLDPFVTSSFTSAASDLVFNGMFSTDERGQLTSGFVRRWERLSPSHYRIKIDPEMRFSDGSAVTPEDVVAVLSGLDLRASPNGEWIEIESKSSLSLEATLLQASIFKRTAAGVIGTGQFVATEADAWHISLKRIKPMSGRIGRVEIQAFPTSRDVFARVLRGEANAAFGLDERQVELIEGVPGLKILRSQGPHAFAILLNPRRLDRVTRRSIRDALSLHEIGEAAYGDACHRGTEHPVNDRAVSGPIQSGHSLEILTLKIDPGWERAALAVRRALGPLGGKVERLDPYRGSELMQGGNFDLAFMLEYIWPSFELAYGWQTGALGNWFHYSNRTVDDAFLRGDYAAAQAELDNDAVLLVLCRRERIAVVDARIKDPRLGLAGILESLPEWEVEP